MIFCRVATRSVKYRFVLYDVAFCIEPIQNTIYSVFGYLNITVLKLHERIFQPILPDCKIMPLSMGACSSLHVKHETWREQEADIIQVYLLLCNNILSIFKEVDKKLERNDATAVDFCPIMKAFRDKLMQRRKDSFPGYLTKVKLQQFSSWKANTANADFQAFLSTVPSYMWISSVTFQRKIGSHPPSLLTQNWDTLFDMERVVVEI